ncbi:unnamed protein product [Knipowitschia caucasica]
MNICDFMVWTQTDTITRRIKKDEPFLKEKLRKAELFFMNYLLPELICRYQDPQLAKEISSLHCEQPSDMIKCTDCYQMFHYTCVNIPSGSKPRKCGCKDM